MYFLLIIVSIYGIRYLHAVLLYDWRSSPKYAEDIQAIRYLSR
jgi:hypothetical protein